MADPQDPSTPGAPPLRPAPEDAPPPVAAALRRGGWIAEEEVVELLGTPPPVQERSLEPGEALMEVGGREVRVRTTPPPAMRQVAPAHRERTPTATIEEALRMRKASAPPAPRVKAPETSVNWVPALFAGTLVVVFVVLLFLAGPA